MFDVLLTFQAQIFDLNYRDDRLQWECDNGGQLWNSTNANMTFTSETASGTLMPSKFCDIGVHQTYLTFVFCLAIDFVLLCYGESTLFLSPIYTDTLDAQ